MPSESLIARYARQARALLPPGRALSREVGSIVRSFTEAAAVECARIHERMDDLYRETVPGSAVELLPEWETALGLPDCEESVPETVSDRQAAVVAKIVARGGQQDAVFEQVAAALGADITLERRHLPMTCLDPCTSPVASPAWIFHKDVIVDSFEWEGEDHLGLALLLCRLRLHAHIYAVLTYPPESV